MNKAELIDGIAAKSGLNRTEANKALAAVLDTISEGLKQGEKISLIGFGTFSVGFRPSRKGINPLTKKPLEIADRLNVKFKPGKELSTNVDANAALKKQFRKELDAKNKKAKK